MTKSETMAYYDALGDHDQLICVDSFDDAKDIISKINVQVTNSHRETFHIEVFHKEMGVQSYTIMLISKDDEPKFDCWSNMVKSLEQVSSSQIADFVIDNMPKTAKSPYIKYIDSHNADDTYTIKSFNDPEYSETLRAVEIIGHPDIHKILGVFENNQKKEYHAVNHQDLTEFEPILEKINDDAARLYAQICLKIIPDYVFETAASNDRDNRSAGDLTKGGLKRHLINTANMLWYLTELEYAQIKCTQHERDMMLIAALFHDCLKNGWQEDYNNDPAERFDHPRLAANALRSIKGIIPDNDIKFITNAIESHMGNRNTNPDDINCTPLPIPDTEYKYLVQLADFLTTRKEINFSDNGTIYVFTTQEVKTIKNFKPITEAELVILKNALDQPVDLSKAENLDIHCGENKIKATWSYMIQTQRATDAQLKYIELANQMLFY